jgi:hypothetical protein
MLKRYVFGIVSAIALAGTGYLTNTLSPLFGAPGRMETLSSQVNDERVQKGLGFGDVDFSDFSNEDRALDVLIYANLISESILSEGGDVPQDFSLVEQMKLGGGDCRVYTSLTYAKFLALTDMMEEPELRDDVRMVGGFVKHDEVYSPHAWLEVKMDGNWEDFESTALIGEDRVVSSEIVSEIGGLVNFFPTWKYISYQSFSDGREETSLYILSALSFWPGQLANVEVEIPYGEEGFHWDF